MLCLLAWLAAAGCRADYSTAPLLKNGAEKWRVGYYEGGTWPHYRINLVIIIRGLMDMGWIRPAEIPNFQPSEDNRPLWRWLGAPGRSDYIEFVQDAYWTSGWDGSIRTRTRKNCVERLRAGGLDLMLAMGTWAGEDLSNNRHSVPTVIASATDPVASGFVKGARYSGIDHVVAKVEPRPYARQIHLAFDIFDFNTVGVIYDAEDSDGRVLGHIDYLEEVAAKRGFKVLACHARDAYITVEKAVAMYQDCVRRLAPQIDILYLTDHHGTSSAYLFDTLEPLYERGIPAWSGRGSTLVKSGALMSIFREDYSFLSPFLAGLIARIFNGAKPGELDQRVDNKPQLVINRKVADIIGYKIPSSLEKIASAVYDTIDRNPTLP